MSSRLCSASGCGRARLTCVVRRFTVVTLKPQLSTFIAMMLGGLLFFYMGAGIWMVMGEFHWVLLLLAIFGSVLIFFGIHILMNRKHHTIQIGPMGIKFTNYDSVVFFDVQNIHSIRPVENFKGRTIQIELKEGEPLSFDCRHHCSIAKFIKHCKAANLPCA